MARVHLFSDEAGDFTFRRTAGASEYFLIATIMTPDCHVGDDLQALQRELAWKGIAIERFHAVDDRPGVRAQVYDLLSASNVRIDATVLHKPKAQDHLRANPIRFYKMATYLHFKYVVPRVSTAKDDLMVVASSLQIAKKKAAVHEAVRDVVDQVAGARRYVTAFFRNDTDPCLQLADYAAWAIQRSFERGDDIWLNRIRPQVASIFEPWRNGSKIYY